MRVFVCAVVALLFLHCHVVAGAEAIERGHEGGDLRPDLDPSHHGSETGTGTSLLPERRVTEEPSETRTRHGQVIWRGGTGLVYGEEHGVTEEDEKVRRALGDIVNSWTSASSSTLSRATDGFNPREVSDLDVSREYTAPSTRERTGGQFTLLSVGGGVHTTRHENGEMFAWIPFALSQSENGVKIPDSVGGNGSSKRVVGVAITPDQSLGYVAIRLADFVEESLAPTSGEVSQTEFLSRLPTKCAPFHSDPVALQRNAESVIDALGSLEHWEGSHTVPIHFPSLEGPKDVAIERISSMGNGSLHGVRVVLGGGNSLDIIEAPSGSNIDISGLQVLRTFPPGTISHEYGGSTYYLVPRREGHSVEDFAQGSRDSRAQLQRGFEGIAETLAKEKLAPNIASLTMDPASMLVYERVGKGGPAFEDQPNFDVHWDGLKDVYHDRASVPKVGEFSMKMAFNATLFRREPERISDLDSAGTGFFQISRASLARASGMRGVKVAREDGSLVDRIDELSPGDLFSPPKGPVRVVNVSPKSVELSTLDLASQGMSPLQEAVLRETTQAGSPVHWVDTDEGSFLFGQNWYDPTLLRIDSDGSGEAADAFAGGDEARYSRYQRALSRVGNLKTLLENHSVGPALQHAMLLDVLSLSQSERAAILATGPFSALPAHVREALQNAPPPFWGHLNEGASPLLALHFHGGNPISRLGKQSIESFIATDPQLQSLGLQVTSLDVSDPAFDPIRHASGGLVESQEAFRSPSSAPTLAQIGGMQSTSPNGVLSKIQEHSPQIAHVIDISGQESVALPRGVHGQPRTTRYFPHISADRQANTILEAQDFGSSLEGTSLESLATNPLITVSGPQALAAHHSSDTATERIYTPSQMPADIDRKPAGEGEFKTGEDTQRGARKVLTSLINSRPERLTHASGRGRNGTIYNEVTHIIAVGHAESAAALKAMLLEIPLSALTQEIINRTAIVFDGDGRFLAEVLADRDLRELKNAFAGSENGTRLLALADIDRSAGAVSRLYNGANVLIPGEDSNALARARITGIPTYSSNAAAREAAHHFLQRSADGSRSLQLKSEASDLVEILNVDPAQLSTTRAPVEQRTWKDVLRARLLASITPRSEQPVSARRQTYIDIRRVRRYGELGSASPALYSTASGIYTNEGGNLITPEGHPIELSDSPDTIVIDQRAMEVESGSVPEDAPTFMITVDLTSELPTNASEETGSNRFSRARTLTIYSHIPGMSIDSRLPGIFLSPSQLRNMTTR